MTRHGRPVARLIGAPRNVTLKAGDWAWQGPWDGCELANTLPPHHKDPMDRMVIAMALDRALTAITDDDVVPRYGVTTIW